MDSEKLKERRKQLIADGKCIDCAKPRDNARSKQRCLSCLAIGKQSTANLKKYRYYRKLCLRCGQLCDNENFVNCTKCRNRTTKYSKNWYTVSGNKGRIFRLLQKYKHSDKKRNLVYDLDPLFLQNLFLQGCNYCGELREFLLGADRIDNTKGHSKENVVAACCLCNGIRGSMPYDAWLVVAKAVKEAKQLGLFGNWIPINGKTKFIQDQLNK